MTKSKGRTSVKPMGKRQPEIIIKLNLLWNKKLPL